MKFWLILLAIWCFILFLYSVSATIVLGEEREKAEKKVEWLEAECERLTKENRFYRKENTSLHLMIHSAGKNE